MVSNSDPVRERVEQLARSTGTTAAPDAWAPHRGPQERFLALTCFEALYGGAAGGGKSDAILVSAVLPIIRRKNYGRGYLALLLRRTFPELETSLIRRSHELYPKLGGLWTEQKRAWIFPGGESVLFGHLEGEKDVHRYQGSAFQFVGFDELTTFTEYQYLYLFSRVRSAQGIPCRVRAASNPGGIGHAWVRRRWFHWVSRKSERPAASGEVRWFRREGEKDTEVERDVDGALGRTFVPAKLSDNPALQARDPGYRARLQSLPRLERLRLENGDWDAAPAKRDFWDRDKIIVLRACPADAKSRARAWDFAASVAGDFYVGGRCSQTPGGLFVIEHIERGQGGPHKLDAAFERIATSDRERYPQITQWIPQDPGAAGKLVVADFQRRYPLFAIRGRLQSGDKQTRFNPVSSRALSGNVAVVDDGSWDVNALHEELEALWDGSNDDQADAISDGYAAVTGNIAADYEDVASELGNGFQRREETPAATFWNQLEQDERSDNDW